VGYIIKPASIAYGFPYLIFGQFRIDVRISLFSRKVDSYIDIARFFLAAQKTSEKFRKV
jgi:hypothetical protein